MSRILSIDGGGIRGLIPLRILVEVEKRTGRSVAELFDIMAGTSTGGLIVLALNQAQEPNGHPQARRPRFTAAQILDQYQSWGQKIFPPLPRGRNGLLSYFRDEKYPSHGVETAFREIYGTTSILASLGDVMITSYDLASRNPYFFKRFHDQPAHHFLDVPMWEVARCTTAAPTYFEPYRLRVKGRPGSMVMIDGGVFANNPAMCAYTEALGRGRPVELMLSLGTGSYRKPFAYEVVKDMPVYRWARPIAEIMMYSTLDVVDHQLAQLMQPGQTYFRFQPELDISTPDYVDDASLAHMQRLLEVAETLVRRQETDIDRLCENLMGEARKPWFSWWKK